MKLSPKADGEFCYRLNSWTNDQLWVGDKKVWAVTARFHPMFLGAAPITLWFTQDQWSDIQRDIAEMQARDKDAVPKWVMTPSVSMFD